MMSAASLKLRTASVLATSSLALGALVLGTLSLSGCGGSDTNAAVSGSLSGPEDSLDDPNQDSPLTAPLPSPTPFPSGVVDPCIDPLGPKDSTVSTYRTTVCRLVNRARETSGIAPLTLDLKLTQVSQGYAARMANEDFFDHTAPDGSTPSDRIKAGGITFSAMGENIARGQKTPEQVFKAWWNSPGHKQNMMNPNYMRLGIGFQSNNWVQNFVD